MTLLSGTVWQEALFTNDNMVILYYDDPVFTDLDAADAGAQLMYNG